MIWFTRLWKLVACWAAIAGMIATLATVEAIELGWWPLAVITAVIAATALATSLYVVRLLELR